MDVYVGVRDFAKMKSGTTVGVDPAISDLNITAVLDALKGVSIGSFDDTYLVERTKKDTGVKTAAPTALAQRTTKWRVSFTDNVNGELGDFTIPCADLLLLLPQSHFMNVSAGAGLALVAAVEANGKSRDGNDISVIDIQEISKAGQ